MPLKEDTGCGHDIEFILEVLRELVSATAHPELATFRICIRLVEDGHELFAGIDANDAQTLTSHSLPELQAEESRSSAYIQHNLVRSNDVTSGFCDKPGNLINYVVRLVEVDSAGPFVVPLGRKLIVEVSDSRTIRIIVCKLTDGMVAVTCLRF